MTAAKIMPHTASTYSTLCKLSVSKEEVEPCTSRLELPLFA